jgi:tetratricopeptide (TPR) repeat protein
LYVAGEEMAKQRDYESALEKYLACVEKEPGHVRALTRIAEVYFRRTDYVPALEYARKALAIDAYDAGANFIYGIINREIGRYADAKDGFGWASRSLEFRSAAYEQLAEVNIIEKRLERAAGYAQRSLDYSADNLSARELQAILFRLRDERETAAGALGEILRIDPLSHFARFELSLLGESRGGREAFTSLIRSELPHETYLELAMRYFNLGLTEEAAGVLVLAPSNPVVDYWLAYLWRGKDAAKSRQRLEAAEAASAQLVYPHRREDIPVLRWAADKTAGWKTSYYLGLVLWNIGRIEEARDLFKRLADKPDWAPFYLTRARLLESERDGKQTLADIQRAIGLDKENWRAWRAQTEFFEKRGDYEQALLSAQAVYSKQPDKPALAMDYAKALLRTGKYADCLAVLERTSILPYEGAWEGRDLYRQGHLLMAALGIKNRKYSEAIVSAEKAKLWPEHLGVGRPYDVDERAEDFILAAAFEKTGDLGKAAELYASVCAQTDKFRTGWDSAHLLGAVALRKTRREDEADRLLADWRAARGEENPVFVWALATYHGDEKGAESVLSKLRSGTPGAAWDLGTGDRNFPLVVDIASACIQK